MSYPVYLVAGESFLADEALARIRAENETDPLSEAVFDADADPAEVVTALGTGSLLGGKRLVVVQDAHALKKDQVEAIAAYLEAPFPTGVLVLIAAGRSKLEPAVKKTGTVVTLEAPKGRRLVAWLRERSGGHGFQLDDRGAWALIDAVGTELRDLDNALAQLGTGLEDGARATAAQVKTAFPRLADERIFAFTDAVGDRRLPQAMEALRRLLEQGDEPLLIFGALVAHVRRLMRARAYADQGTSAVGAALGLPGWRAERLTKQARSYREDELAGALSLLAETDLDIKSGEGIPTAALEKVVVRIVGGG